MEIASLNFPPLSSYRGKTVLVTGHTGFKGAWLVVWLQHLGAKVIGFSLDGHANDYLYRSARLSQAIAHDVIGDIKDFQSFFAAVEQHKPDIIFHLAAQALVRASYDFPLETIKTNTLGTAHVLEAVRLSSRPIPTVIVTSDKCYHNSEGFWGYRETDPLGGDDPYSASKGAAELLVSAYRKSFLCNSQKLVASVRAGNVIGGGDYSSDRIVPDCIKHLRSGESIRIRNPSAVRPWQHVLEPLYGYLLVGSKLLAGDLSAATSWNFGPDFSSVVTVQELVEAVVQSYGSGTFHTESCTAGKKESTLLALDSTKARHHLGWKPLWNFQETVKHTVDWYCRSLREDAHFLCLEQIKNYTQFLLSEENIVREKISTPSLLGAAAVTSNSLARHDDTDSETAEHARLPFKKDNSFSSSSGSASSKVTFHSSLTHLEQYTTSDILEGRDD